MLNVIMDPEADISFKETLCILHLPQRPCHVKAFGAIYHLALGSLGTSHGQDLQVNRQCRLPDGIKPLKAEVLCDVAPLEVWDVLLDQTYMWK